MSFAKVVGFPSGLSSVFVDSFVTLAKDHALQFRAAEA